jgi:hypothetical protein
MNWSVNVKENSFERAGITKDRAEAICEYIQNGFEADATTVTVEQIGSELSDAMAIRISDNGTGIPYSTLPDTFGAFLSSTKAVTSIKIRSQANKGKGRFSYMAFTSCADWETVFNDEGTHRKYTIHLDSVTRTEFETSEPLECDEPLGTFVTLPVYKNDDLDLFVYSSMKAKLLEEFAWFLYLNREKGLILKYCGSDLNYSEYIDDELSSETKVVINGEQFTVSVIVWKSKVANSSKIYFMDNAGSLKQCMNTTYNHNTADFFHAVFVQSTYFSKIQITSLEDEPTLFSNDDQRSIIKQLKRAIMQAIEEAFHNFLIRKADNLLDRMEKRKTLPQFPAGEYGELQKKDFFCVTREIYCAEPRIFHKLKSVQEKSLLGLINLLLSSDERDNILAILESVVTLTSEQRKNFADILKRSSLEHIIDVTNLVQRRYDVITELKSIVYEYSKFANERDHIQKIIEQHYWLFGEQYSLVTADRTIRTSLEQYEQMLRCAGTDELRLNEKDLTQRMDVFLYSSQMTEMGQHEGLIVELKAPSVSLSLDVFNQIDRYAHIIHKEPRFQSADRTWRFIAVCKSVDDEVKLKYPNFEKHGKKCLVDIVGNCEVYAMSWDDIFTGFNLRHRFLLDKLRVDYEQSADEGKTTDEVSRAYVNAKVRLLTEMQV